MTDMDENYIPHRWIRHGRAMLHFSQSPPATKGQLTSLAIRCAEFGITDRERAIGYCSCVVGRSLNSRKELTTREASLCLDVLEDQIGRKQ